MKKTLLAVLLIAGLAAQTNAESKKADPAPFALLSLKLEGCASCEGCRTAMRQVVQGEAKASRIKLSGMTLTATFDQAAQLPVDRIEVETHEGSCTANAGRNEAEWTDERCRVRDRVQRP